MRPSITKQVQAELIDPRLLKPSPRNYNPGVAECHGRTWMAYRSHRTDQDGRCAVAICELKGDEPGPSQWLNLGGATGREHHEDPRLFVFDGKLHVAYSETTFPKGRDYIAVQKYARLERVKDNWKVAEVFRPRYGNNYADLMEKNWQFFEHNSKLHAIYCAHPVHVVIQLNGSEVVREFKTTGVTWPWGEVRGGTPPIRYAGGWITFFHSSTPTQEGNWRRYWMGAYIMDDEFRVTSISRKPIAGGSEEDDHGHDPRSGSSWKPYVVFPCGAIYAGDIGDHPLGTPFEHWFRIVAGINDWRIAIIKHRVKPEDMCHPGEVRPVRYFKTRNGQRPIRLMRMDRTPCWLEWERVPTQFGGGPGLAKVEDPWFAEEVSMLSGVSEITAEEYAKR